MKIVKYISFAFIFLGLFIMAALPDSSQSAETNQNTWLAGITITTLSLAYFVGLIWKQANPNNSK